MDSLADCITFGIAPAVLAFAWGIFFVENAPGGPFRQHILRVGVFVCFLYLLCGAARLARFNIQTNPVPKNPGRPDRKYFVGLPIPAAAGMVAASIYATDSAPLTWWIPSVGWVLLLAMLSFLMVSTWRYRSFKDFNLLSPRSFKSVILLGSLIYLILHYSQPVLLGMAIAYVGSGIAVRLGGLARRRFRPSREEKPQGRAEHQVG
jgi:CDP-diacylglycerol--serine O-phosphatidyltransferase